MDDTFELKPELTEQVEQKEMECSRCKRKYFEDGFSFFNRCTECEAALNADLREYKRNVWQQLVRSYFIQLHTWNGANAGCDYPVYTNKEEAMAAAKELAEYVIEEIQVTPYDKKE